MPPGSTSTHSAIVSSSSWAGTTTSTDHGSLTSPPHIGSEAGLGSTAWSRCVDAMLQTRILERFVHLIAVQDVISTAAEPVNGDHRAAGAQGLDGAIPELERLPGGRRSTRSRSAPRDRTPPSANDPAPSRHRARRSADVHRSGGPQPPPSPTRPTTRRSHSVRSVDGSARRSNSPVRSSSVPLVGQQRDRQLYRRRSYHDEAKRQGSASRR